MKPSISLRRYSGRTKSGCSAYQRSSRSWYADRRKNQFLSVSHWSATSGWFGQIVPRAVSSTSVALRKPSFGQYQPSYVPT